MTTLLRMPAVTTSATSATLTRWCLTEGAEFAKDDVIALVETDKAEVEIPAETGGVLARTLVQEGEDVPFGEPVAVLAAPGERIEDSTAQPAEAPEPDPAGGRVFASPLARKLAKEAGLVLADLTPTGPGGRILRRDVDTAIADRRPPAAPAPTAAPAPAPAPAPVTITAHAAEPVAEPAPVPTGDGTEIPHTPLRRATAERLTGSFRDAPHFYLRAECRVDDLVDLLGRVNDAQPQPVTVTDLLLKAVATAHTRVPELNVVWTAQAVRRFPTVDVALAITTDDGLVTGVLRDLGSKSLSAVAAERQALVTRARSGRLRATDLGGGTITVSNLGMFGVEEFSAIINPPHAAILAAGAIAERPVVSDGTVTVARTMKLVLSVDHRPVDGTVAARWLNELTAVLHRPLRILC